MLTSLVDERLNTLYFSFHIEIRASTGSALHMSMYPSIHYYTSLLKSTPNFAKALCTVYFNSSIFWNRVSRR